MKATRLADLFYQIDVNPFYVVSIGIFIIPILIYTLFHFILTLSIVSSLLSTIIIFIVCSLCFLWYFHRNPKRAISEDPDIILSPADGRIVYIKKIKKGSVIESVKKGKNMKLTDLTGMNDIKWNQKSGWIIGVEMRLFDVHITRAPVKGKKVFENHISGNIVTMNNPKFEWINERVSVVLEAQAGIPIGVVQIASFLARTIKSYVQEKDFVNQGEQLGIIRFGSQVDLIVFSENVEILASVNDRVYAGITPIAEMHSS